MNIIAVILAMSMNAPSLSGTMFYLDVKHFRMSKDLEKRRAVWDSYKKRLRAWEIKTMNSPRPSQTFDYLDAKLEGVEDKAERLKITMKKIKKENRMWTKLQRVHHLRTIKLQQEGKDLKWKKKKWLHEKEELELET